MSSARPVALTVTVSHTLVALGARCRPRPQVDNDGQILLIEAAPVLPSWITPDNSEVSEPLYATAHMTGLCACVLACIHRSADMLIRLSMLLWPCHPSLPPPLLSQHRVFLHQGVVHIIPPEALPRCIAGDTVDGVVAVSLDRVGGGRACVV